MPNYTGRIWFPTDNTIIWPKPVNAIITVGGNTFELNFLCRAGEPEYQITLQIYEENNATLIKGIYLPSTIQSITGRVWNDFADIFISGNWVESSECSTGTTKSFYDYPWQALILGGAECL
jgi:hypothetical protein